jgi:DNA-directed RNA polymerase subunit RPC12/RpoP
MSIIEGSFKCDAPPHGRENRYETVDPAAWEAHLKEHKTTESGSSVCATCGKHTEFTKKTKGLKPMCDECKQEYLKNE